VGPLLFSSVIAIKEAAQRQPRKAKALRGQALEHSADYAAATAADSRTAGARRSESR